MPDLAPGQICPKCNAPHNMAHCQAHSRRQGGNQCERTPIAGMDVCSSHGGRSPLAQQARDARIQAGNAVAAAAVATIVRPTRFVPVTNPLLELQLLAGEAKWWKETMSDWVAQLKSVRYGTDGGEAIRGEVILFERAIDRCLNILVAIAKLEIDERLVRIEAQRRDMIVGAVLAGLDKIQLSDADKAIVRAEVASRLRIIAAHPANVIDGTSVA